MELKEYQEKAMTTCMPSSENFTYMFYNLLGEVGELADKVESIVGDVWLAQTARTLLRYSGMAKEIRKNPEGLASEIWRNAFSEFNETLQKDEALQKEAGDILWQLAGLCSVMGWKLEDIAQQNLDKLASRQQRNVIDGDGDNR